MKYILPLFLILILSTTACASTPVSIYTPLTSNSPVKDDDSKLKDIPATDIPKGRLDAIDAIETALTHTPGAVIEIDDELDRWEVTVLRVDGTAVELYIDAATGKVERERGKRTSTEKRIAPIVTAVDAIGAALVTVPGRVVEADLDTERGALFWEVSIYADSGGRFEIHINATSGAVEKVERED